MDKHLQLANDIHQAFMNYGRKQAALFEKDNIAYTNALLILSGSRGMMAWMYSILKCNKLITPLEDLSKEEKTHMWEFVKEICGIDHQQKEKMIQMTKAFYALEYFLNEK